MDESKEINYNGTTHLTQPNRKRHHQAIVWRNVMLFGYLHLAALYGVLLMFTSAKIATTIFGMLNNLHIKYNHIQYNIYITYITYIYVYIFFCLAILMYQVSSIGITAGAHRLWSHRAYKAKWPLRVILIIFNTIAFQVFFVIIIIIIIY
jgi:stearoyl-CoA desaturase (Delta-9 desaturase)